MDRNEFKLRLEQIFNPPFSINTEDMVRSLIMDDKEKISAYRDIFNSSKQKIDHYLRLYDEAPTPEAKERVTREVRK